MCFEKCVSTPGSKNIGSGADKKTDACLMNCVERFFDVTTFIVERFQSSATQGHE